MKPKHLLFFILLSTSLISMAQTPTGTPISYPGNANPWYNQAWFRGGNLPGGAGGFNNIFGTFWNSPIFTYTNGTNRTRLNADNTTANIFNTTRMFPVILALVQVAILPATVPGACFILKVRI
jgi:hypothetical protein